VRKSSFASSLLRSGMVTPYRLLSSVALSQVALSKETCWKGSHQVEVDLVQQPCCSCSQ